VSINEERRTQTQAREALRTAPYPVFIMTPVRDEAGAIVELLYSFVNDAALKLYGMSNDDVVGRGLIELFPSSRDNGVFDADVRAIRTQGAVVIDVPWVDENGVRGAFTQRATPYEDGVLVTALDVTAARLERSYRMLRATQGMARLGSWSLDLASNQVDWSEELFELFGRDPALPAPSLAEHEHLYGADGWAQLVAAVAGTSETGLPYDLELETFGADSARGWVHVRGEVVRDDRGRTVGLLGYVMDITERKVAEQALAASESLFRAAMMSSPVGMALSEVGGSWRVVNSSMSGLLGRDEAWLTSHSVQDVVHPDDAELLVRLRAADVAGGADAPAESALVRLVRADGHVLWVKRAAKLIAGTGGRPDFLLVQYVDTTAEHEALEQLAYQAFHDPLTGLRNRAWIVDGLEADLEATNGIANQVGVLFVDLDHFKIVNDSLGHAAGDELLVTVADRIASVVRPTDRLGRMGGDEFIIVVPDVVDARDMERVAEQIVDIVGAEVSVRGHKVVPAASIGIALNAPDSTSESLLRDADTALFRAKAAGRARWQFFDDDMHAQALARLTIEDEIREALSTAQFVVHYQPIVTLADRRVVGHEALVRWQHPVRGLIPPILFIPAAEDSGLIVTIGQHVLDQVCALLASNPDLPGPISVNISPVQLAHPGWLDAFTDTLSRHGVDPRRIVIEITETAAMALQPGTPTDLAMLRGLGVGIHVDDFGTGFSSISLLRDLPVTGLKLDASFAADLSEDDEAANALSAGLAGLANGLHLTGVAEGVESESQHRLLLRQGWSHAQGYLYARPSPTPIVTIPMSQ